MGQFEIINCDFFDGVGEAEMSRIQKIIDKETGIEYLYVIFKDKNKGGCALTPLLNTDGTPKINNEY